MEHSSDPRPSRTRRRRTIRQLSLIAMVVAVASSCLVPSGPIRQVTYGGTGYDTPDPAAVPLSGSLAQMYSTNAGIWPFVFANVPSYTVNLSTGAATAAPFDALPTRPNWNVVNTFACQNWNDCSPFVWAPTVRKVGTRYLMMFSGSRQVGEACIGAAWSNSANAPFTKTEMQWCDNTAGLLDPQLFVNSDGAVWVYYSRQQPGSNYSEIKAQRISISGTSISKSGGATTMLTVSQARSVCGLRHPVTNCTVSPGVTPDNVYVENPAMVRDPHNNYNLLVSVGNWQATSGSNQYRTVEVPCGLPNGDCAPNFGATIAESSAEYRQSGGASLLRDDTPQGNYMFFHAKRPGSANRSGHIQGTVAISGS